MVQREIERAKVVQGTMEQRKMAQRIAAQRLKVVQPLFRVFTVMARFSIVCVVCIVGIGGAEIVRASESCGSVAGMKGIVEILRSRDGDVQIRNGFIVKRDLEPLLCDDVILTGKDSAAKVLLGDVRIVMGAETRVEIAKTLKSKKTSEPPKVSLLALSYGKLRALVKKASTAQAEGTARPSVETSAISGGSNSRDGASAGEEKFRIKTATAVAGVRGTDFFTSYDPNTAVTDQATVEGAVMVRQVGSKRAALVAGGNQVSVEPSESLRGLVKERADESLAGGKEKRAAGELLVIPMQEQIKNQIRVVSTLAKADPEFTAPQAVKVLGKPELWTDSREKPPDTEGLKNEF